VPFCQAIEQMVILRQRFGQQILQLVSARQWSTENPSTGSFWGKDYIKKSNKDPVKMLDKCLLCNDSSIKCSLWNEDTLKMTYKYPSQLRFIQNINRHSSWNKDSIEISKSP
jgi:hypothetical protein